MYIVSVHLKKYWVKNPQWLSCERSGFQIQYTELVSDLIIMGKQVADKVAQLAFFGCSCDQ